MAATDQAKTILHYYGDRFTTPSPSIDFLGSAGGYSGAQLWRVSLSDQAPFLLRRWPAIESANEKRLRWIHRQLATGQRQGCEFLPVPLFTANQESLVEYGDHFWQLEPWMPGVADYWQQPSPDKMRHAVQAVAQVHSAWATQPARRQVPDSVLLRIEKLSQLFRQSRTTDRFRQIQAATVEHALLKGLGFQICERFCVLARSVAVELNSIAETRVEIQTIIGDVWHDHVLFTGDQVSGLVDFGAMRVDCPAADLARLLGSLVQDDTDGWEQGFQAYDLAHPQRAGCPAEFRQFVGILDRSNTLLSGMNWLCWICLEGKKFGDLTPIQKRLQQILKRMDFLAAQM